MNDSPWGGSEELWARVAVNFAKAGAQVAASVHGWSPLHSRITALSEAGIRLQARKARHGLASRLWHKMLATAPDDAGAKKFIRQFRPDLVILSCTPFWMGLLEYCATQGVPFVTVSQANTESLWPDDATAEQFRTFLPAARRCFFVADANRKLFENQIGADLQNAEVVWNPYKLVQNAVIPWPRLDRDEELRFAHVARLHPPSKGQDLVLQALAMPPWRARKWHLTFYGEGRMKDTIWRMIQRLNLEKNVSIAGFVHSIEDIWAKNHVLVMPSRYEGTSLAMLEAMLCGRCVLATDVADHATLIREGETGFVAEGTTPRSVAKALERLWVARSRLQDIGASAAADLRSRMPANPVEVFADKLAAIAASRVKCS
jgi:glycosyltransferase involved in cell wall biosynthesis